MLGKFDKQPAVFVKVVRVKDVEIDGKILFLFETASSSSIGDILGKVVLTSNK